MPSSYTPDSTALLDLLAGFPLFAAVPRAQLAWFVAVATVRELAAGEELTPIGGVIAHTYVVLRGTIHIFDPRRPEQDIQLLQAGSATGYLPFSRLLVAGSENRASEASAVLAFPKARTHELAAQHFELTQALVGVMTSRVRETTAQRQLNEKLMALGKLSAGLAHELNNPIGALASTVDALGRHAQALPAVVLGLLPTQADALVAVTALFAARPGQPALPPLVLADREEDLSDWLDAHHVPQATALAEALAEAGAQPADLTAAQGLVPAPHLALLLQWAHHQRQIARLVADAHEAASRVTALIQSVKVYTHLDQAPVKEPADLHVGLRNTLTMLGHKIRQGGVRVYKEFASDLPPVPLLVGAMNQVWTNLLDNALDALVGVPGAVLHLSTRRDGAFAQIIVADNGPGIPPDMQSRVFDPFFTTKAPGQGTGMGLDVVQRIVRQHRGSVKLTSQPGRTAFEVCLPLH